MNTETQVELLSRMEKIDKDIQEAKIKRTALQRRQEELHILIKQWHDNEAQINKTKEADEKRKDELQNEDPEVEYKRRLVERFSYKNTDLINKIYRENRAKAKESHDSLLHLNYNQEHLKMPLYNQPSDLLLYHENIENYKSFRPRLIKFLQQKRQKEIKMELRMEQEYDANLATWLKKLDKFENNPKRKQRQQKSRLFFEREFPEIKKQREQQERFDRLGSRSVGFIRSEAEVKEIADNLAEIDATAKQMRSLAVKPPHLLCKYERRMKYINNNGLIRNLKQFEIDRKASIIWSDSEKQIFREKFAQFPKDFEKIASFLKMKNCSDCVLFYYLNKKKEYFKSKLRKKKGKLHRAGITMHNKQKQKPTDIKDINMEVEIDEEEDDDDDESLHTDDEHLASTTSNSNILVATENKTTSSEGTSKSILSRPTTTHISTSDIVTTKSTKSNTHIPVKVFNTRSGKLTAKANAMAAAAAAAFKSCITPEPAVKDSAAVTSTSCDTPKPPLKITIVVTSPSNVGDSSSTMSVASIKSETVTAASSIITDQTLKISSEVAPVEIQQDDQAVAEKVEELIKQHLTKMPEHSDPSRWSETEMMKAVDGLKRYGRNWQSISKLVETKSEAQCKNFYFNYKKKFNLESILGIAKSKEKEESAEHQEGDLVPYLEELDRLEQLEKQQKVDNTEKQNTELKTSKNEGRGKATRYRSYTKKTVEKLMIETESAGEVAVSVMDVKDEVEQRTTIPPLMQDEAVPKTVVYERSSDEFNDSRKEFHEEKIVVVSQETVLRPPPPLVTYNPSSTKNSGEKQKLAEIKLRQGLLDVTGKFQQKLELPFEKERKQKQDDQTSPTALITKLGHSQSQYLSSDDQLVNQELLKVNVTQPMLPNKINPGDPTFSSMEQNVAIKAFTSYQGYMSLPSQQVSSQADLPSGYRFKPSTPSSSIATRMPLSRNLPQQLQLRVSSQQQLPASLSISHQAIHSPVLSNSKQSGYSSPGKPELLYQSQLDELQRQRDYKLYHRQQKGKEDLVLLHEIEAEREAQIKFKQNELEVQRREAEFRKQEEMKYLHLKKIQELEFERRREEEVKQMRLRELGKHREMEIHQQQRRLFAEKMHEHGPMSQDMVMALLRHFGPYENPDNLMIPRGETGSQEDIRRYLHETNAREQYLMKLPNNHPRTRAELHQRAASIPDLRTNLPPVIPDKYRPELGVDLPRVRTQSGSDPKSVIPHDKSHEYFSRQSISSPYRNMTSSAIYDKFGEIKKEIISTPDVPLESLSRPGSTGSDVNESIGKSMYGISTGRARQLPLLTSITGGLSKTPPEIRVESTPMRHSPHDPSSSQTASFSSIRNNIEQDLPRRKSAIVRPWEIESDIKRVRTPPPTQTISTTPKPNTLQPVIQLAPTSNQFKEQIINLAQKNSPAPQMFPKFIFSSADVPNENQQSSDETVQRPGKRDVRSNSQTSEQSLSPTFPMPLFKASAEACPPIQESEKLLPSKRDHSTSSRPRSDSEETISADESDLKDPATTLKQSLLMRRLTSHSIQGKQDRTEPTSTQSRAKVKIKESPVPAVTNSIEKSSSLPVVTNITEKSPSVPAVTNITEKSLPVPVVTNIIEKSSSVLVVTNITTKSSPLPVVTNISEKSSPVPVVTNITEKSSLVPAVTSIAEKNSLVPVVTNITAKCSVPVVTNIIEKSSPVPVVTNITTKSSVPAVTSIAEKNSLVPVVTNITAKSTYYSDKAPTDASTVKQSTEDVVKPHTTLGDEGLSIPVTVSSIVSRGSFSKTNNLSEKELRSVEHVNKSLTECTDTEPRQTSTTKPNPELESIANKSSVTSSSNNPLPAIRDRAESPDIYDDLKVHDYVEHSSDSPNDLYSDMKPGSNDELKNLTAVRNESPQKDIELFYTNEGVSKTENEIATAVDQMNTAEEDLEVSKLTSDSQSNSDNVEPRSNASTPVMDEPQFSNSKDKADDTSGSTPEAKTPLMDEPAYTFEAIPTDTMKADYLQYTNQPTYLVNEETKSTDSQARLGFLKAFAQSQEAFESITPPSSPEHLSTDIDRKPGVQTSTSMQQPASAVAFPFSALAFSVGSRPGSRSSSTHSPNPSDERSPRYDSDNTSGVKGRRKRSRDRDDVEEKGGNEFQQIDVRRVQDKNYRRSGSQSSSSSFSKSPEYEFKSRKSSRHSPKTIATNDQSIDKRESSHKLKHSGPTIDSSAHSKKPRT